MFLLFGEHRHQHLNDHVVRSAWYFFPNSKASDCNVNRTFDLNEQINGTVIIQDCVKGVRGFDENQNKAESSVSHFHLTRFLQRQQNVFECFGEIYYYRLHLIASHRLCLMSMGCLQCELSD